MCHKRVSSRLGAVLSLALLLLGALSLSLLTGSGAVRGASPATPPVRADEGGKASLPTSELTHDVYLPLVTKEYGPRSFRMGYCAAPDQDITRYPSIRELAAGWYPHFDVTLHPARPSGAEPVQTIRLHQLTECWPNKIRDRNACPYVTPYTYTLQNGSYLDPERTMSLQEVSTIAKANPGSLWFIGNEMDRYDWGGVNPWNPNIVGPVNEWQGQDEMLPQVYARAYHELHHLIKQADPTALVAIGGIIQATPARLWYVDTVWHAYQDRYGTKMPVDVWNIHNFILKERCDDYGADIPPGCPPSVCETIGDGVPCYGEAGRPGEPYADENHNNMAIFAEQIVAFRQWMKDHGQQNKPLVVSEYGILYHHAGMEDLNVVRSFMLDTFDYFMTAKDPNLGYPADDDRLVQRWAWFSLDVPANWNQYSYLMDPQTRRLTALGEAFSSYAQDHLDVRGNDAPNYWP